MCHSKDEWDAKYDTGKFMKNVLCVLQCAKKHFSTLNSEKIKPVLENSIECKLL